MSSKSLWGDLKGLESVQTPATILQEQAGLLGQLTDEVLEGQVRRLNDSRDNNRVLTTLYIVAPALRNYKVSILEVDYSLAGIYPVTVYDSVNQEEWQADSHSELEEALSEILSSGTVRNVITSLIAESQLASSD